MKSLSLRQKIAHELNRRVKNERRREHQLRQLFWECTWRCNLSCRHCGSDCKSGNDAYVEVHIKVDPEMNVRDAHAIATATEDNIKAALPKLSVYVTTHIEPAKEQ